MKKLMSVFVLLLSTEVAGGFKGFVISMHAEGEETVNFGFFKHIE